MFDPVQPYPCPKVIQILLEQPQIKKLPPSPNNPFVWLVAGYRYYDVFPYLCYLQKSSSLGFLVIDLNSVLWGNPERG